jgi:hypothetical protein
MTNITVFTTQVYGAGETRSNADCGIRNVDYGLQTYPSFFPSPYGREGKGEGLQIVNLKNLKLKI